MMAKILSSADVASYSPLVNLFGPFTQMAVREFGALEYDATLNINSGGSKPISPFDLSSYSQLVNMAGTTPTTKDARGATVLGAQREWGALEYNSALPFSTSPKLVSPFDFAGYSRLINFSHLSNAPYLPTRKDARGIIAPFNAGFTRSNPGFVPTTKDARLSAVLGGIREWGALEYDSTLVIGAEFPSTTEIANAVWQTTNANLIGTMDTAGANVAALTTRTNVAQTGGASTITLDQGASTIDNFYRYQYVVVIGGTGIGQARKISSYVGSTRVATIDIPWSIILDSTSKFAIVPFISLPTAIEIRQEMDSNSVDLDSLIAYVDELESRLTAARAGYLDNLSVGAVALQASVDDLEGRLSAARALLLDNLVNLDAPISGISVSGANIWDYLLENLTTPGSVGAFVRKALRTAVVTSWSGSPNNSYSKTTVPVGRLSAARVKPRIR